MPVFKEYSKYYNLLYKDKNYSDEADYIEKVILNNKKSGEELRSILEIGCGTGQYTKLFAQKGYDICALDYSSVMLGQAAKTAKNINYVCADGCKFSFKKKFDAAVSLFHVVNYFTDTEKLQGLFKNIYNHIAFDGLFIFDFWHGAAVLSDPPVKRTKEMEDEYFKIKRYAVPEMLTDLNTVIVNYKVFITDKIKKKNYELKESHKMRYLFGDEIKKLAEEAGFSKIGLYNWFTFDKLTADSWYGLAVLKK